MTRKLWLNMKIGFVSLGCPKNQTDTEVMLHELLEAGYEIVADETEADIAIVNTCAFIESAKRESIDAILDLAWLKEHKNLKSIIVAGCLAERYRDEIFDEMPEVDAIIGVGSIHSILDAVRACEKKQNAHFSSYEPKEQVCLGGDRVLTGNGFSTYLKIAEGCDNRCAYCAIPSIRGRFRSRTMEDIIAEAKQLDALGVKELNIVAQDITRYGIDLYGKYSLAPLLHKITEETDIPWIRLLYCYPDKITDELIAEIRDNKKILKYVDLPIQHISDHMLKSMNRHGDGALVRDTVRRLREAIPGLTLRTTLIVGFPGETEEDFLELAEYVKETRFERLGCFTYSREEGTPAYDFPDQIDEQVKNDRMDVIMREQLAINAENNEKLIGKTIRVLCEDCDAVGEIHYGRPAADAPDIDGKVYFTSPVRVAPGSFIDVKVKKVLDYDLVGSAVMKNA